METCAKMAPKIGGIITPKSCCYNISHWGAKVILRGAIATLMVL